jgi:hypothetical protein
MDCQESEVSMIVFMLTKNVECFLKGGSIYEGIIYTLLLDRASCHTRSPDRLLCQVP